MTPLRIASASRFPASEPEASRRHWRYAVVVGGCAECGNRFADWVGEFLPVEEVASDQTGGGGSSDGTAPNVYDILSPSDRPRSVADTCGATGRCTDVGW